MTLSASEPISVALYSLLLRVRPNQLAEFLKKLLRVQRRCLPIATGHLFWTDPASVFGLHLLGNRVYEQGMTRLLQSLLRPADTFVDIGGNEGYFSVLASSAVPFGVVHCIEPQSRLQEVIRKNVQLNSCSQVITHPVAITDKDGTITLFLRPSTNTGASSLFRYWRLGSKTERVSCCTLDSFFEAAALKEVRLMKVDCEGAEHLVILGARGVLRQRKIQFIAMEYHPTICGTENCTAAHAQLLAAGYALAKLNGLCIYHVPGGEDELRSLGELQAHTDWM